MYKGFDNMQKKANKIKEETIDEVKDKEATRIHKDNI
jgi:hypothetical protein